MRGKGGYIFSIASIFVVSSILRFWNLSQFNTLVFDEVYYAKYANNYLTGTSFFNSHPPLSQYIIALGIWLASHFPAPPDTINNLTGSLRSTFSYRWLNALTGSFIPLLVGAVAYQLTRRRSCALLATLFVASDGLFLVESRYALNNIYLVLFGLLGQWLFLLYINHGKAWQIWMAGIFFGSSIAIKWNGLSFLLGAYLFLAVRWLDGGFRKQHLKPPDLRAIWALGGLPFLTYSFLWIPHLLMNPQYSFWKVHQKIWEFHHNIGGNTLDVHPYCSPWYSWPIMGRPIAYFYEISEDKKYIYDVHAMGNPILLWLSTLAILWMLFWLVRYLFFKREKRTDFNSQLAAYLTGNYAANLLLWLPVKRCTFLYHYMGAYTFAILALAWLVDCGLRSRLPSYRRAGIIAISLIVAGFIYWMPIYLGLPLSQRGYQLRLLFPHWI